MSERISVHDILEAGIHTRGQTLLWNEVEDALTPRCEHSQHNTDSVYHGGEVHRLITWAAGATCDCAVPVIYVCDRIYADFTVNGAHCHHGILYTPEDLIVLAVF